MKKKTYITPTAKEVNLLTMEMLATSTEIKIDKDKKGGEQLSNERHGDWGELWN